VAFNPEPANESKGLIMISEIAQIFLILTTCLLIMFSTLAYVGIGMGYKPWHNLALQTQRPTALLQGISIWFCFGLLVTLFVTNDFTIAYVAENSNSFLPWWYRMSAVWGGHEGSLLLWAAILSGWYFAVAVCGEKKLPPQLLCLVSATLAFILAGFLLFILFTSNPFAQLPMPTPIDGQDLNPLLQDIGLIIHPPLLYMGYVGLSVAFAFAVAGLIHGDLGPEWARWTRPWTLVAWSFLTVGIALGSWWAYYELGWGGWWFWDPVENASLMPWLAATGLIHSLAVTDKRGMLKAWTLFLAILAFSLSLLGTFLVRSGVLTSVHAFANDPTRGLFILALLGVVIGGSLTLFACRAHLVESKANHGLVSRESGLLLNNIVLVTATFVVLIGTLYPLGEDMLGMSKSSVGAPYFNAMFVPLGWMLLLLLIVGPRARWKKDASQRLLKFLGQTLMISVPLASLIFLIIPFKFAALISGILCLGVLVMIISDILEKTRYSRNLWHGCLQLKRHYWGMQTAHFGLVILTIGITGASLYSHEKDQLMVIGDSAQALGDYKAKLNQVKTVKGPNYKASVGEIEIVQANQTIVRLFPEKRFYATREAVMTEAAMDASLFGDIYVALGEQVAADRWAVRLHFKSMIRWVWGGAFIIAFGGLLSATDRRLVKS